MDILSVSFRFVFQSYFVKSSYFKEWFSFSRSEKNGILVLLVLIVALSSVRILWGYFKNETTTDFTEYEEQISRMTNKEDVNKEGVKNDSVIFFVFDPNTVSKYDFEKLGFSEKNAETLDKYRKSKGVFKTKDDFRKLYFINDSIFNLYSPYIVIEPEESEKKSDYNALNKSTLVKADPLNIELNGADSALLEMLPGIGPSFASRIVKYRKKLGGFYSVSQLLEVYGFTAELFEKVKGSVYVNPDVIVKINVNKAEFKELIRHPYLNKLKVIKILDFRKVMKRINNVDELVKNKIIEPSDSEKLIWYFSFD